jgi:hypothetical protein
MPSNNRCRLARVRTLALAAMVQAGGHAVKLGDATGPSGRRPVRGPGAKLPSVAQRIAALPPCLERAWLKSLGRVPGIPEGSLSISWSPGP